LRPHEEISSIDTQRNLIVEKLLWHNLQGQSRTDRHEHGHAVGHGHYIGHGHGSEQYFHGDHEAYDDDDYESSFEHDHAHGGPGEIRDISQAAIEKQDFEVAAQMSDAQFQRFEQERAKSQSPGRELDDPIFWGSRLLFSRYLFFWWLERSFKNLPSNIFLPREIVRSIAEMDGRPTMKASDNLENVLENRIQPRPKSRRHFVPKSILDHQNHTCCTF